MSVSGDGSPGRAEQAIILAFHLPGTPGSAPELTGQGGVHLSSPRMLIPSLHQAATCPN